ncbi:hypothetical protein BZL30_1961 [Mycobacterium kansasii]|uniref:Uncharacterized protein n=1 Tax=Mycobacterium kansasii TaxID=1768 RepID=A0A1V3XJ76_MYCKA|nr:hypothetical protein BZL30_1961 [Mycobacterium kansasii]
MGRARLWSGAGCTWLLWCGLCPVWDVGAFGVVGGVYCALAASNWRSSWAFKEL